ncbi:MAG TPA: DUF5069 domain-containing protein [Opitutales bacterium]|nr:DUF5069 domain-containing protein [Opitutales bacterium]
MSSPTAPRPDTGAILYDLPSPYVPHPEFGLLHLPRFIAKIRKHLAGELPPSYQRNFTRGFDGFLCLHLGVDPQAVIAAVRDSQSEADLTARLRALFPADARVAKWNRELVQKGMSEMGREALEATKKKMAIAHRDDLRSFADMIEYDEGRVE